MAATPHVELINATLHVHGVMTLEHAAALESQGLALLRAHKHAAVRVDLSAVAELDSSSLAVLFSWQREQKRLAGDLAVVSAPEALQSLARVYSVVDVLTWV